MSHQAEAREASTRGTLPAAESVRHLPESNGALLSHHEYGSGQRSVGAVAAWRDAMSTLRTQPEGGAGRQRMSRKALLEENRQFRGTTGVSGQNRSMGFRPAFRDLHTGEVYLARFADGSPAPCHVLDGLPAEVVECRDSLGRVTHAVASLVSGFLLADRFYTREQAAEHAAAH